MREMNSGVAEDIVNGETAMVGTRQEMGIIGFRGDATTAQPRDVLAADTHACRHPAASTPIGRVGPVSGSLLGGQNCVPSNNTDSSRVVDGKCGLAVSRS